MDSVRLTFFDGAQSDPNAESTSAQTHEVRFVGFKLERGAQLSDSQRSLL